jgi:hypothetical protein
MAATDATPGPLTRALTRFTTDSDGNLRSARLLGIAFIAGLVVAIGTTIALVAADAGNPATLSIWVLVAFLGVKLPLLGLLWWILGRRQRDDEPTADELRAMIVRLRTSADAARRTPDARDRLEILRDEAWFVADRAPDELKAEAVELALRLDSLSRESPASRP